MSRPLNQPLSPRTAPALPAALLLACAAFINPVALGQPQTPPATPPAPSPAPVAAPKIADPRVPLANLAHVETRGTGPIPMILIPGMGCDWSVYDTFMTRNAERYTMHAVTLPGFAGTEPPVTALDAKGSSDMWLTNAELAILKLIEDKGIDRPVIVGHAMGGHLAYRLAARAGDKFRAAVVIDGLTWIAGQPLAAGNMTPDERRAAADGHLWGAAVKQRTDEQWQAQSARIAEQSVKDPQRAKQIGAMMARTPSNVAGQYMMEYFAGDLTSEIAYIKIPTLAIIAISDLENPVSPNAEQKKMRLEQVKGAPAVTAVIFDNTRTFVMDDAPERLDKVVATFLAGEEIPDAAKHADVTVSGERRQPESR